jgi:hypothetical protein
LFAGPVIWTMPVKPPEASALGSMPSSGISGVASLNVTVPCSIEKYRVRDYGSNTIILRVLHGALRHSVHSCQRRSGTRIRLAV